MIASKGERLYLQRDGVKSIHIDLPRALPLHQINGIRFLYRQYKKKAPGVILNDPSGYGKCLQVTLFLSALQPILKKPVLILSNSLANWKEHFENWTDCGNELIMESSNPFTKQLIKINPAKDGFLFSRRSWSVVVLHDENNGHEFLPLRFNADYKIWITRDDLKENLYTLASIYEWLHPNQKFNLSIFTAERDNKRDIIEKAVLLDAFLEDFLIRRTDFDVPFEKLECHKRVATVTSSPAKNTRKDKDPTGAKVKRSKKNTSIIENNETENVNSILSTGKVAKNKTNVDKRPRDDNMDVEDFICDEEPMSCDGFNFLQSSKIAKSRKNKDPTGTKVKRSKITVNKDGNVSNENICSDVNDEIVGPEELCNSKDEKRNQNNVGTCICDERCLHSEDCKNNDSTSLMGTVNLPESSYIKFGDISSNINNGSTKEDADEDSSLILRYTETEIPEEDTPLSSNVKIVIAPDTEEIKCSDTVSIHKNSEVQEISVIIPETLPMENSLDGFVNKNIIKEEKPSTTEEINIDNISNYKENSKINKEVDKSNTNKVDDFDAKLAEMEAKALQRLKSSILDSLF